MEEVSRSVKSEATRPQQDTLRDRPAPDSEHVLAEEQKPLFEVIDFFSSSCQSIDLFNRKSIIPKISMMKLYNLHYHTFLNKLTISNKLVLVSEKKNSTGQFSVDCIVFSLIFLFCNRIWLSLKQLVDKGHFEKLRFWGKIHGTQKNYFIAEAEQSTDETGDDDDALEESPHTDDNKGMGEDDDMEGEEDPLPKSTYKQPAVAPKEDRGTGVNKYTYYVCNHRRFFFPNERIFLMRGFLSLAGAPWVKLPIITPAQIAQARLIRHFFTGDLDHEIASYPVYPGTEKNYLRAQIARISATTHVSPSGKFKFSEVKSNELEKIDQRIVLVFLGGRRSGRGRRSR